MKYFLLIASVIIVQFTQAQSAVNPIPHAYVHSIAGNATVLRKGKPVQLKQWDYIFMSDTIRVQKATVVKLYNLDNNLIELNKTGTYIYNILQKNSNAKRPGITTNFLKFVWHEFFGTEDGDKSQETIGGAIGGPVRGICKIKIIPEDKSRTLSDTIRFSWKSVSHASQYTFTLQSQNSEHAVNIIAKDTFITVLKSGLLQNDSTGYTWIVAPDNDKNGSCNTAYSFILFSPEAAQNSIDNIIGTAKHDEGEFTYYLTVSSLLANAGWFQESLKYFEKAKPLFGQQPR